MEKKYNDIIEKMARYAYKEYYALSKEEFPNINDYLKDVNNRIKEHKDISDFDICDLFLGNSPIDYELDVEFYDGLSFLSKFVKHSQLSEPELNDFVDLCRSNFEKLLLDDCCYPESDDFTTASWAYEAAREAKIFYDTIKDLNDSVKCGFIQAEQFNERFADLIPEYYINFYDKMVEEIKDCSFDICKTIAFIADDKTLDEKINRVSGEMTGVDKTYNIFGRNLTISEMNEYFVNNFPQLEDKTKEEGIEALKKFFGKDIECFLDNDSEWINLDYEDFKNLSYKIENYREFLNFDDEIKEFINKFSCFEKVDFDQYSKKNMDKITGMDDNFLDPDIYDETFWESNIK